MIRRLAALLLLLPAASLAAPAAACPPASDALLFHSCWGEARLELLLLPEDLPLPTTPVSDHLIVTGAYTGRDTRENGAPNPVGLFMHHGKVVNPNLGRMDGIVVIQPANGQPEVHHRARLRFAGQTYDLRELDQRRAFLNAASAEGLSVLQSHLLVADGATDLRPDEDAPLFVRRFLFTDEFGFGVYQTSSPMTLFDAAEEIRKALAPRMALNLDMGSYDYCQRIEQGTESSCGSLDIGGASKLSNLLMLTLN